MSGEFAVKVHGFQDASEVIAFFDNFDFVRHPEGLQLAVKRQSSFSVARSSTHAPVYYQNIPGMGMLEVKELTAARYETLPTWPGWLIRGGQLFIEDRDTEDWTLLLVGARAVTRLYPNVWEASPEEISARFSETSVDWQAA